MVEDQALCVKERTLEPLDGAYIASYAPMHAAVERIADDWVSDGTEVHANLMRSSRVDRYLAKSQPRKMMGARDTCHGLARVFRAR